MLKSDFSHSTSYEPTGPCYLVTQFYMMRFEVLGQSFCLDSGRPRSCRGHCFNLWGQVSPLNTSSSFVPMTL